MYLHENINGKKVCLVLLYCNNSFCPFPLIQNVQVLFFNVLFVTGNLITMYIVLQFQKNGVVHSGVQVDSEGSCFCLSLARSVNVQLMYQIL